MLGLRSRHAWREPRLDEEAVVVALVQHLEAHQIVQHCHRDEKGGCEGWNPTVIVGRSHADDGVAAPSHPHRAADHPRIAAEGSLPVAVAEHHDQLGAPRATSSSGRMSLPRCGSNAENAQCAAGDRFAHDRCRPCRRHRWKQPRTSTPRSRRRHRGFRHAGPRCSGATSG